MQFSESQAAQLNVDFKFLNARRAVEGQTTAHPEDFKVIAVRAVQYGALTPGTVSCWVRAMIELEREGVIKLRKPAPRPVEVTQEFRNDVQRMSSSELLKRMQRSDFKAKFDQLAIEDAAASNRAPEDPFKNLTKEQWHGLPIATASRLMLQPNFRAAVQRLIDQRLI